MRYTLRLLLSLTLLSGVALSLDAPKGKSPTPKAKAETSTSRLLSLLNAFESYQADFEQQTHSATGKKIQSVKGVVKLRKPGHFFWQAYQPYPQLLISNGVTIWQYDEDLAQVVIKPYKEQLQHMDVVQLLENPLLLVERYQVATVTSPKKAVQIFELTAKDKAATIKSLGLTFTHQQLSGLYFVDALNQKTSMTFTHRHLNKKLADKIFNFTVPKGVDVIGSAQTFPLQ